MGSTNTDALDRHDWTCLACGLRVLEARHRPWSCGCGVEDSWHADRAPVPSEDAPIIRAIRADSLLAAPIVLLTTGEHRLDELLGGGMSSGAVLLHGARGTGKSRLAYRWATRETALIACPELELVVARSIISGTGGQLANAFLLPHLANWKEEAERIGASRVVLDSIAASSDPVREVRAASEWGRANGALVFALAHETKSGDHRGDSSIAHWADYELQLRRGTPPDVDVEILKSRLSPGGSTTLSLTGYCNARPQPVPSRPR